MKSMSMISWWLAAVFHQILFALRTIGANDNPLSGKHLSVATAHLYAVVDIVFDADGKPLSYDGVGYEHLKWLSRKLNFSFEFTSVSKEAVFGSNYNGTWDGLIGQVHQQKVDLALSAFSLTHEWFQVVDLTFPWAEFDYTLFIPLPKEEDKGWATLKPFQAQVWIAIILTLLIIAALFWLTLKLKRENVTWSAVGTPLMYLTSVVTSQGGYWGRKGRIVGLLAATWCFAALMFINIYNGMLVSFLTTTKFSFLVTSLEDLATKPDIEFFTFKDTYPDLYFMIASFGDYKTLGDSLRRRPGSRLLALEDCIRKPITGNNVCIMVTKPGESYLAGLSSSLRQCLFTRIKDTFMQEYNVFALPKNSSYTDTLNKQILWAKALGLDQKWSLSRMKRPYRCLDVGSQQVTSKRLPLNNIKSVFFILSIGYLVSSIAFLVEICYPRYASRLLRKKIAKK